MAAVRKNKKDFNKDQMYKKIMPSLQVPPESPRTGEADALILDQDELRLDVEESTPELPDLPIVSRQGVTNLMEAILIDKMPHTMKVLRSCDCERCQADIMAIALNQLPGMYVVIPDALEREHKLRILRGEYEVKVTAALIKAIQTVKTNPRHEK